MAFRTFRNGKGEKIGVKGVNKKGEPITLLNPNGKGKKYAMELKHGRRVTNNFKRKTTESGKPMKLTEKQRSFRAGYLQARKDSANCYKAQKAKRANKNK